MKLTIRDKRGNVAELEGHAREPRYGEPGCEPQYTFPEWCGGGFYKETGHPIGGPLSEIARHLKKAGGGDIHVHGPGEKRWTIDKSQFVEVHGPDSEGGG